MSSHSSRKPLESSGEDQHLSSPVPLSVPSTPSHPNRDASLQTEEALSFSAALRQLQAATQAKAQLEWELLLKWEGLARNHEGQQARMAEHMDTAFREVLSQMNQADLVRLLPCFLSIAANPSAGPICSVSEALTTVVQPRQGWMPQQMTPL